MIDHRVSLESLGFRAVHVQDIPLHPKHHRHLLSSEPDGHVARALHCDLAPVEGQVHVYAEESQTNRLFHLDLFIHRGSAHSLRKGQLLFVYSRIIPL